MSALIYTKEYASAENPSAGSPDPQPAPDKEAEAGHATPELAAEAGRIAKALAVDVGAHVDHPLGVMPVPGRRGKRMIGDVAAGSHNAA